jgi:RHS repeat-associated protein
LSSPLRWHNCNTLADHRGYEIVYRARPDPAIIDFPEIYDSYGQPVWPQYQEAGNGVVGLGNLEFRYKGQSGCFTDTDTDLLYCTHRYYDPQSGRWTSRDPVGLAKTFGLIRGRMASIALTKEEHPVFTKTFRRTLACGQDHTSQEIIDGVRWV